MSDTLRLTEALIALPSVTPNDAGCQTLIAQRLQALGFVCETLVSGPEHFRVTNLWARRPGAQADAHTLVFAGHTDVVPTGPREAWRHDPFLPTVRDGHLYGRGAADMKASLAGMVVACEEFLAQHPNPNLAIAFLLTSDEEGPANDGTVVVCQTLAARGEKLDYCIVGEPTSVKQTGDMIKNGRRGTMSGRLTVKGIQGHIAYPHLARNPIHMFASALAELVQTTWDAGNEHFPPTTWQISNYHSGTGASNVIPGQAVIDFNFRFNTESSAEGLQRRFVAVLAQHQLQAGSDYDLTWTVGGHPFLTRPGTLVDAVRSAIEAETGLSTELSTSGGTSDGRFIAQICPQILEFGPPNATIHKVDECVAVADLEPLKNIYRRTLEILAGVTPVREAGL